MKTFGRRTLSIILSVMMVLSCFAGMTSSVGAETSGDYEYAALEDGTISITRYNGSDTDVVIPSEIDGKKVSELGDFPFGGLEFNTITIPDGIIIGVYSLGALCVNKINVSDSNDRYSSVDGVLFNKDMTRLIQYPKGRDGGYIIPDGVEAINLLFIFGL